MNNIKFNIAKLITCTETEGPHKRLAIWFQGCNLECQGCFNPDLIPLKVANIISINKLLEIVLDSKEKYSIEGITLLGGEPTMQNHLNVLCEKIQEMGLGIILFTGKLYEELDKDLIKHIDMIIDGPFVFEKLEKKRKIIGSTNQKIINVSERYVNDINWFYDYNKDNYEINISNKILINGEAF